MSTFLPEALRLDVGRKFQWKLFFIVWAATMIGVVAVVPYTLTLQSAALATANLPMPLPLLLALQMAQNAVIMAIAVGLGLFLAARIGLGLPFIEGWLNKQPIWETLPRIALIAVGLGVIGGGLIIALDVVVFAGPMADTLKAFGVHIPASSNPPAWQGLLASFYGGIAEEVQLRLLVMTLLAWLGRLISRTDDNRPTAAVVWIANILAAILFGLGHLPATAGMGIPLTAMVITRAVVLNGLFGVIAGWLYQRWGLEAAMISHFSGDIVVHVILPLLGAMAA